ncbi:MAG: acyl-[acyl-carrier-protein] thioesterase [Lachnospiraceae bacterium]|jgi:medium-chain acyl-[acyl-carrier-protein] hydrolase|nr:acyl-[acyl-carrier-protein] thioesterase [Lachnospiraceae bacterium]
MYAFQSRVRYSEAGEDKKITLLSILNYFQDCSTFQSEGLGVGLKQLEQRNRVWVLNSWQIVVNRYADLCEEISTETWPYEFNGFTGSRNFAMRSREGELLAYANSLWAFVDTERGRPVKAPEDVVQAYTLEERLDMDYAPRKVPVPEDARPQESFLVHVSHLDSNHHVNNGQYVQMAKDYLPQGFSIRQMRAEYKKSAVLGDRICPQVKLESGICTVALCDEAGKPYATVEFQR